MSALPEADRAAAKPLPPAAGDSAIPPDPFSAWTPAPDSREAGLRPHKLLPHAIVAGAIVIAMLAGVGVTLMDYPLHAQLVLRQTNPDARATEFLADPPAAVAPTDVQAAKVTPPTAIVRPAKTLALPTRIAKRSMVNARPRKILVTATQRIRVTANKPSSIDRQYNKTVEQNCRRGAFGFLCREAVRWRLCRGRWSDSHRSGETRCYVAARAGRFPPV